MMQEKEMVNDALNSINSGLTSYASMIAQTENQQLRTTLQQMRDQAEQSQYDLYTIAKNLGYYTPAQQASEEEIMKVKSEVAGSGCSCSSQQTEKQKKQPEQMTASSKSEQMSSAVKPQSFPNDIKDMDEAKMKALQAPPKTESTIVR